MALDHTLKVRVDAKTKRELDRKASTPEATPSSVARRAIRYGLANWAELERWELNGGR